MIRKVRNSFTASIWTLLPVSYAGSPGGSYNACGDSYVGYSTMFINLYEDYLRAQ